MAIRTESGGTSGLSPSQERADTRRGETLTDTIKKVAGADGPAPKSKSANDPLVFTGWGGSYKNAYGPMIPARQQQTATLTEVAGQYYEWDQKTRDKFLSQLNLAGYNTNNMRDSQIAQMWGSYSQQAAAYYSQGRTLTPWDVLALDMQQREAYMNTPRSVTQTSTAYNLSTREDAQGIFLQAAQSLLGRDPTKAEIASFQKALNAYEKANPTTTTTTTDYLGDQVTGQSTTSKGGVTDTARNVLATEDIKKDPEYGAYQAATTYFDAMMQMIGG